MAWGECYDPETGVLSVAPPLIQNSGGNDVDITQWGAQRINLCIYDVQKTIMEGISAGPIVPFNISGGTGLPVPGNQ